MEHSKTVFSPSSTPKPRLLDRVRQAIRTRHYSPRTEETYVGWIKRFIFYHNKRHPAEMGETEIARFLSSLASESHVSSSTQNQAFNALLFLYQEVLHRKIGLIEGVVRAKTHRRLPVVLTKEEVQRLLACLEGTPWLMAMLLYGAGLRLMECCRLRVKDIDFYRNQIVVRAGKGDKDRHTMLPATVKEPLLRHLQGVKRQHTDWPSACLLVGHNGIMLVSHIGIRPTIRSVFCSAKRYLKSLTSTCKADRIAPVIGNIETGICRSAYLMVGRTGDDENQADTRSSQD